VDFPDDGMDFPSPGHIAGLDVALAELVLSLERYLSTPVEAVVD